MLTSVLRRGQRSASETRSTLLRGTRVPTLRVAGDHSRESVAEASRTVHNPTGRFGTADEVSVKMATPDSNLDGFTDRTRKVVRVARNEAVNRGDASVSPEHILLAVGIVEAGVGRIALERLGADLNSQAQTVKGLIAVDSSRSADGELTADQDTVALLEAARSEAKLLGHSYVGTEHLVLGLLHCNSCPARTYLEEHGITLENLRNEVIKLLECG